MTFLCYEATASLERDGAVCISRNNVVCGGAVYCGIGSRRLTKPDFDQGLELVVGANRAYSTKETMRRIYQQLPHFEEKHTYLVMGKLEDMDDPEVVMIIADPQRVMRPCKACTWTTGELVHALGGTNWCGMSFPAGDGGQDDDVRLRRSAVPDLHAARGLRDVLHHPLGPAAADRREPEERVGGGGLMVHFIMESCIICGTCWDICPVDAVVEFQDDYRISDLCDECGKCVKACPNGAISNSVSRGRKLDPQRRVAADDVEDV
jgi:ferredoxin